MKNDITKITLYNLDGTTSEMKFIMPRLGYVSEAQETVTIYLDQIVQNLTRFFLKIRGYKIEMGVINDKGEESYCCYYAPFEIPLNKVYVPSNDHGQWVDVDEMKKAKVRGTARKTKAPKKNHIIVKSNNMQQQNLLLKNNKEFVK